MQVDPKTQTRTVLFPPYLKLFQKPCCISGSVKRLPRDHPFRTYAKF